MYLITRALSALDKALGLQPGGDQHDAALEERSLSLADTVSSGAEGQATPARWDEARAVEHGLEQGTWVFACVGLVARSIAALDFSVYEPGGKSRPDHPLTLLLNDPNDAMDGSDLVQRAVQHLLLSGNTVLSKVRDSTGVVAELWPLPPHLIKPVVSRSTFISSYRYESGGERVDVAPDDVIHVQMPNPGNPWWGIGPYQAGRSAIETDASAVQWNKVALQNRAVSDGALIYDQALSRDKWLEARWRVRQQHMGAGNARMPWVLSGGVRWQAMDRSPVEMDFTEGRRMSREEICALFGVPPVLVGVLDRATYSNFETAREVFWEQTVSPLAWAVCNAFTRALRQDFHLEKGLYIGIDETSSPVMSVTKDRAEASRVLFGMGVPFSELNRLFRFGVQPFEGDDVSYISSGYERSDLLAVDPNLGLEGRTRPAPTPTPGATPPARRASGFKEAADAAEALEAFIERKAKAAP